MVDEECYHLHMRANDKKRIKQKIQHNSLVTACARRHNTVGDISAMRICYLLRHHPNLSVSEIAELVELSVSATSRSLTKLKQAEVVKSKRKAKSVIYSLVDNVFTKTLTRQMEKSNG